MFNTLLKLRLIGYVKESIFHINKIFNSLGQYKMYTFIKPF